ncbi:pseudouridine synthase [uncultured Merdimonas sp.]|uniref:pseudouridine synthase n=1 Tax=uncultured Merdimonas sp. TaxID=2023269 RepID=UPI00320A9851
MYHLSSKTPLHILYEDTQIIVCVKPPGIATQTRSTGAPDMVRLLKQHLYQINPASGEPYLAVIHRLDQPVSGLLVFAKTPAAARELNRQLQNPDKTSFGKYYCALVEGPPSKTFRHPGKLYVPGSPHQHFQNMRSRRKKCKTCPIRV